MLENVSRKIAFVAAALILSLGFLLIPKRPFEMGLDLQGGTRLVYSLDLSKLPTDDNIVPQVIEIVRSRIDPTGVREASIRQEGQDRFVVELPGTPDISAVEALGTLSAELDPDWSVAFSLEDEESVGDFPLNGGTVQIGSEKIRYEKREGLKLLSLKRGHRLTPRAAHTAGEEVRLSSDDAIKDLIENLGDLGFHIQILASDLSATDTDLTTEESKLRDWTTDNPGLPMVAFNEIAYDQGGPHPKLKWVPRAPKLEGEDLLSEFDLRVPLLIQEDLDLRFVGRDVAQAYPARDNSGFPAVGFEMVPARKTDFGKLTGDNIDRLLVITLNDAAESIATINDRLPGGGIIMGRFTNQEVIDLVTVIRSGSLPIKPVLRHEEVVGPTLGKDYVDRGFYSGIAGLLAVVAFMIFYYRRLGIIAALALTSSLVMLLGGLAFLRATITLPGIAGVILTVGMAVDANILIFDRVREELDRGQNVKQAAKTGFEKAFSAIFDANLTTLITALILYKVGTGPVRGFAVTLSIGIIASMISALILTRLLVHWSLERGVKAFPMGQWLVKARFDFISKARLTAALSTVVIVASVTGFVLRSPADKMGIDFLGGGEVQIRTEDAQTVDSVRDLVFSIPGAIGESAEVKPVLGSALGDGYTSYRITFKVTEEVQEGEEVEKSLKAEIGRNLESILQKGPVELSEPRADGAFNDWDLTMYFVDEHPVADIHQRLTEAGTRSPSLVQDSARATVYSGSIRTSTLRKTELESLIGNAFNRTVDSNGIDFNLAEPIPSSTLVGPQVVGELRNKAVIALIVSLFAVVLYIRVRFFEYSYGFAAVAALTHDVLVTLGAITLADYLGIINGEITLPMVAAFLTIIGYSLNDTIVVFDRVRENLPRMKKPMAEVLNTSINQTLSRTVLTSLTTLLAVSLLFGFNYGTGNTLEGFAFAMLIGVITGTYSTIFIANPVLLWLETRADKKGRGVRSHLDSEERTKEKHAKDDKAMVTG